MDNMSTPEEQVSNPLATNDNTFDNPNPTNDSNLNTPYNNNQQQEQQQQKYSSTATPPEQQQQQANYKIGGGVLGNSIIQHQRLSNDPRSSTISTNTTANQQQHGQHEHRQRPQQSSLTYWWNDVVLSIQTYCCCCLYSNDWRRQNNNRRRRNRPSHQRQLENSLRQQRYEKNLRRYQKRLRIQNFITNNRIYRYCIIWNVFVLLFAGSIRDTFVSQSTKDYDLVFNILFTIALVQFTIDIIIRFYCEQYYFNFFILGYNLHPVRPLTPGPPTSSIPSAPILSSGLLSSHNNKNSSMISGMYSITSKSLSSQQQSVKSPIFNKKGILSSSTNAVFGGSSSLNTYDNDFNKNYSQSRALQSINTAATLSTTTALLHQSRLQQQQVKLQQEQQQQGNSQERINTRYDQISKYHTSIGSFLFWCDLLSTLTLFVQISWFNHSDYQSKQLQLYVDQYGIPLEESFLDAAIRQSIELDSIELFITVGKTARMARFIGSANVVKWSKKVNWYFFVNIFNLYWWIALFQSWYDYWLTDDSNTNNKNNNNADATNNTNANGDNSNSKPDPMSLLTKTASYYTRAQLNRSTRNVNTGPAARNASARQGIYQKGSASRLNVAGSSNSNKDANRRLQNRRKTSLSRSVVGMVFTLLGRSTYEERQRREKAARTIQRCWRRARARKNGLGSSYGPDMYYDYGKHYEKSAYFGPILPSSSNTITKEPTSIRSKMRNFGQSFRSVGGPQPERPTPNKQKSALIPSSEGLTEGTTDYAALLKRRNESQVGTAMRELTAQRVAIGILVTLIVTVMFTHTEANTTRGAAMITLHTQTKFPGFADNALDGARNTSIPDLFSYQMSNGEIRTFNRTEYGKASTELSPHEILIITVNEVRPGIETSPTIGYFNYRSERQEQAIVGLLSTLFIILIWFFGATAFTGPVMVLIVIPMERMVRLLAMLTLDPLGYQTSSRYRKFVDEEDEITKNTRWTKEVLKGMETSFLMSTILRIGSLMQVGFGSAGAEIIRKNLERGNQKNMLTLSSQGSTVSCIFLFCDIRNFTDATECLQEEVFVFTNQIAAVVHFHCAAHGGSANKNVGDAFLMSWLLEDVSGGQGFTAKNNQADKALLAVVRMCMSLRYDEFYLKQMSEAARDALVAKFKNRGGPIVQMGFGLHAGKAVQGAIGSQKKIDATYVSESVERAEFLESSTKKYGLQMLMSDSFHRLLDNRNKRRCRKVDHLLLVDGSDENEEDELNGELIDLLTFDIDVDAWWDMGTNAEAMNDGDTVDNPPLKKVKNKGKKMGIFSVGSDDKETDMLETEMSSEIMTKHFGKAKRIKSMLTGGYEEEPSQAFTSARPLTGELALLHEGGRRPETLVLPKGIATYNPNVWFSTDMRKIRERYSDGIFFQKFNSGLQAFYGRDWDYARECFSTVLSRFEDGPSRYFLNQIESNKGKPPRDFKPYGLV